MTNQKTNINLRQLTGTDIGNVHTLLSLPQTDEYNTMGIPATLQSTENIVKEWLDKQKAIQATAYTFCIELSDTNQFIGLIALNLGKPNYHSAEVWFKTHADHWGKGYTTEALKKLLHFAFNELKLHRIEAGCAVDNIASAKVLEKAGMKREGRKRKVLPIRGEWKDNFFYAILEEDFLSISKQV